MAEVTFDGEQVVFDGPLPGSVGQLLELLHQAAEEKGHVIREVICDGRPSADGDIARPLAELTRVEVTTCTVRAALRQVAQECSTALSEAERALGEMDRRVLREPWARVREDCMRLAECLGQLLQTLSSLVSQDEVNAGHPGLTACAANFARALEEWVEGLAAADGARICLSGERRVRPRVRELGSAVAAVVKSLA